MPRVTREQVLQEAAKAGIDESVAMEAIRDLSMGMAEALIYFSNLVESVRSEQAAFNTEKALDGSLPVSANVSTLDWIGSGGGERRERSKLSGVRYVEEKAIRRVTKMRPGRSS